MLDEAAEQLSRNAGDELVDVAAPLPAVISTRYRAGDMVLSLFSTIAQFGTAEDIALADLKIELMFPADDVTRNMLMAAAGEGTA